MKQDEKNRFPQGEAWVRFEQTGKICDYLSYVAQKNEEGTNSNAGDSERTCDPRKNAQQ